MNYITAKDAFNSLEIGEIFKKDKCKGPLKQVAKAYDPDFARVLWNHRRWLVGRCSFDNCWDLCIRSKLSNLFDKSFRIGMTTQGDIVLFSDCRKGDWNDENIKNLIDLSAAENINIKSFIKTYPEKPYKELWTPPQNTKMYEEGYKGFYRGTLVGIIIKCPSMDIVNAAKEGVVAAQAASATARANEAAARANEAATKEALSEAEHRELVQQEVLADARADVLLKRRPSDAKLPAPKRARRGNMEESSHGYIYFVQPEEYLGTNRYKIGQTGKNDLSRLKSYGKGRRTICLFEQYNRVEVETEIKKRFNKKFTLFRGWEYFEGDEQEMKKEFIDIFISYNSEEREAKMTAEEKMISEPEMTTKEKTINKVLDGLQPSRPGDLPYEFPSYFDLDSVSHEVKNMAARRNLRSKWSWRHKQKRVGKDWEKELTIRKHEDKNREIRENTPYCLEINDTSNEVYYINRDYVYIGLDTKSMGRINDGNWKREYIYDDGSSPWENDKNYREAVDKIKKICLDKTIINDNNYI